MSGITESIVQIHYDNTPIQIYWTYLTTKNWKFSDKNSDIFIFLLET